MNVNKHSSHRKQFPRPSAWLSAWLLAFLIQLPTFAQDTPPKSDSAASAGQAVTDSFAHSLRVLSYNIHHAEGVDARLDLERIARTIQSAKPDIVALQEVDFQVKRSGRVDQPAELARLTEMKSVFGSNIELQGGKYGNALLARGDIIRSENRSLPNVDQGEQRGILDVHLKHQGQTLRILATHFDHRRDPQERLASIDMVNALVTGGTEVPTLLIGDLNAEFASEVLDRARKLWKVANTEPLPTIPVDHPRRQIDFILCYPPERWRVRDVQVLEEATASDHRPIIAALELKEPGRPVDRETGRPVDR
jgi:endonuclease/exonuclease/phosphatase family metal-dependent hydrolase